MRENTESESIIHAVGKYLQRKKKLVKWLLCSCVKFEWKIGIIAYLTIKKKY